MNRKSLLTLLLLGSTALSQAQNFTPISMRALPVDFPGLNDSYTQVVVDANFAQTGPVSWGLVETIDVTRGAGGLITATDLHSTYPVDIVRANASMTGNVYTSMVEISRPAGYRPYQRETVYTDGGTLDTASQIETYDTTTSVYVNADRWSMTYDGSNRLTQSLHYKWMSGAWQPNEKRLLTYTGTTTQYATDSTFKWSSGVWTPSKSNLYTYIGTAVDSVTLYENLTGTFAPTNSYKLIVGGSGAVDTMLDYTFSNNVWKLSSRIIFRKMPQAVSDYSQRDWSVLAFPNPATEALTIRTPQGELLSAELINPLGQQVRTLSSLHSADAVMPVQGLPAGLYILRVSLRSGAAEMRKAMLVEVR